MQNLLEGTPDKPQFYLFIDLTEILYNSLAFIEYLKGILSLQLIYKGSLVVDLSELARDTFVLRLARC
jgi:hypothetical protein